jgi:acyl carrier protein
MSTQHDESVFEEVSQILGEHIEGAKTISPDSHLISDLGIDSLDFLDIAYAIDRRYGIKVPLERWIEEINAGKSSVEDYFVMHKLCAAVAQLAAQRGSSTSS